MRHLRAVFLTLLILSLSAPALAGQTAGHMQSQYESLTSFTASFVQTLTNAQTGEKEVRKGTIAFRQPALVRWDTLSPEKQLLVVGDKAVWDYYADEKAAYKYPTTDVLSSKTMLRFISGKARLEQDFYVTELPEKDGLLEMELVPREAEPGLVQATVWVTPATYMLYRVLLVDFYGNKNDLALDNLLLNPDLPKSDFEFSPPAGTKVFDNTKK
ncbi:MAG: outer membrane lipoprotein carrier protein LolA [Thermodesulfobacteriota bacterium]